jgi:predicted metal-binding membrane protein
MAAVMTAAMMVAMMMPSLIPTLWRHYRHLRAMQTPRGIQHITLFAAGYATVWAVIGLALFAMSTEMPPLAPWSFGAVLLGVGAMQRSRWKAMRLLRCRQTCVTGSGWRGGCWLGGACALSCAAPMAVLFAGGLMDERLMLLITAAITAERVAPGGVRIARLTGASALVVGLLLCVRSAIPVG